MQEKNSKLDFGGQEIYVGLDTGKKHYRGEACLALNSIGIISNQNGYKSTINLVA